MVKFLTSVCLLLIGLPLHAAYFTIAPGTWSDRSAVWSTDGSTPCGCSPGPELTGPVSVRHEIALDADLTIREGGSLDIAGGAALSGADRQISVESNLAVGGSLSIRSIFVANRWAVFRNEGYVSVSGGSIRNFGTFYQGGALVVVEGDCENTPDGNWDNEGSVVVTNGNFRNYGIMKVGKEVTIHVIGGDVSNEFNITMQGPGSCIHVEGGDFENRNNGQAALMTGHGGVLVAGTITNLGTWAHGVAWCSPNSPRGYLPPEDCDNICGGVYPVWIRYFGGEVSGGFSYLNWSLSADAPFASFGVERLSYGGEVCTVSGCVPEGEFRQIGVVEAVQGGGEQEYYFTDKEPMEGMNFYRLKAIALSGEIEYSKVLVLESDPARPSLVIYPNPTRKRVMIRITGKVGTAVSLSLFDLSGRLVWDKAISLRSPLFELEYDPCNLASGVYLVTYSYGEQTLSRKLVVTH